MILKNILKKKLAAGVLLGLLMLQGTSVYASASEIVEVQTGKLQGKVEEGIAYFNGIPYAAPPVGALRWRPPQAAAKWEGIRDASQYGNQAAQNADLGVFAKAGGSEDCLYLNVAYNEQKVAEARAEGKLLPVFVWIHGGALNVGTGSDYNPSALANAGNVVVTINYRVASLGFFAHPAIDKEGHAIGNYGLMDQNMALGWVQNNISAFGGNPDNVTIAGESSGGQSVVAQMVSPRGAGKFHQVISMSGNTIVHHSPCTNYTVEDAEKRGIAFAKDAGLENATAEELRALTTEQVLALQTPHLLGTNIIDGDFIPEHIGDALEKGHFNQVTFVNGMNRNEGTFFAGMREIATGKIMDEKDFKAALKWLCDDLGKRPDLAEQVIKEYQPKNYPSYAEAFAAINTDVWFAATASHTNKAVSKYVPVYAYEFDDATAPEYITTSFPQKAAHTYELPYIFPGFNGASGVSTVLNEEQQVLADEMVSLFANTSKLNQQNKWERYDAKKNNYLRFTLPEAAMLHEDFDKLHHVAFWEKMGI